MATVCSESRGYWIRFQVSQKVSGIIIRNSLNNTSNKGSNNYIPQDWSSEENGVIQSLMMVVETVSETLKNNKSGRQIRFHCSRSEFKCRHDCDCLELARDSKMNYENEFPSRWGLWRRHPTAVPICRSSRLWDAIRQPRVGPDLRPRRKSNINHHCLFCDRNVNVFMGTWWYRGPSSSQGEGDRKMQAEVSTVTCLIEIIEQVLEMQIWFSLRENNNWRA